MAGNKYHTLIWEQLSGGVYLAVGGRFKISRRGKGKWILIDNATGEELRSELLGDAQSRAVRILNKES